MVKDDPLMVPDGDFHPNILNSIVFILSAWMQLNTFAVNYCGRPFTQVSVLIFSRFEWKRVLNPRPINGWRLGSHRKPIHACVH